MAQRVPFLSSTGASTLDESMALPSVDQRGGGPANRALSELALMFGDEQSLGGAGRWETGKTLRFVATSCGIFWLTVAAAILALR
ncbi:MAG: hypothetical protein WDM81_02070 [Rhizomicrobium sp.]